MFHRNRRLSLIGASVIAAIAAGPAGAQETQLEEVVVTARQRAERIEDVPVTITAFTTKDIKAAGIERPQDFIALTAPSPTAAPKRLARRSATFSWRV